MWKKYNRFYNTLKYLKPKQIFFRIFYSIINTFGNKFILNQNYPNVHLLKFEESLPAKESYKKDGCFEFLNKFKNFKSDDNIDWNYSEYGKLWCYNLNYFEYLLQPNISKEKGLKLINSYILTYSTIKDGLEPYPISLRNINWIKFVSTNSIKNSKIDNFLYSCYSHLLKNIEYHLLGNHLLENTFSLLFGAYYFKNEIFYEKAYKILNVQLEEQVLDDGGHFELSPMYHQILLFRLLDSINLLQNNVWKTDNLIHFLNAKAQAMLSWLATVTFKNGDIPHVNDSTNEIAPTTAELFSYASSLGLKWNKSVLSDSGYRKIISVKYELFIDVGNIGPDYIPGHAQADTFNFLLNINERPIVVDPGISTYEKNKRRNLERSTIMHNTVVLNNKNQSDVWGRFRVGERAKILKVEELKNSVIASHDGYLKDYSVNHQRTWTYNKNSIEITDGFLPSKNWKNNYKAQFNLHFAPECEVQSMNENEILIDKLVNIKSTSPIKLDSYIFCEGFNKLKPSRKAIIDIKSSNSLVISFL